MQLSESFAMATSPKQQLLSLLSYDLVKIK